MKRKEKTEAKRKGEWLRKQMAREQSKEKERGKKKKKEQGIGKFSIASRENIGDP